MMSFLVVYGGFSILGPLCAWVQSRWPALEAAPPLWDRRRWVHWAFWLITPLFTGVLTLSVALLMALGLALVLGKPVCEGWRCTPMLAFEGALSRWPILVQVGLALVLVDGLSYGSHRLRHRYFWRFHEFHHRPTQLDWLTAATLHPVDDVIDNTLVMLPILLLGFDHRVFLGIGPFLLLHTLYLHMAARIRLPILVTPSIHRSHHSQDPAYQNHNFGSILIFWDQRLGTYQEPPENPQTFGVYSTVSSKSDR